jgi:hypothetical protein
MKFHFGIYQSATLADKDYEEIWARLAETLADWGEFGDDQAL